MNNIQRRNKIKTGKLQLLEPQWLPCGTGRGPRGAVAHPAGPRPATSGCQGERRRAAGGGGGRLGLVFRGLIIFSLPLPLHAAL